MNTTSQSNYSSLSGNKYGRRLKSKSKSIKPDLMPKNVKIKTFLDQSISMDTMDNINETFDRTIGNDYTQASTVHMSNRVDSNKTSQLVFDPYN